MSSIFLSHNSNDKDFVRKLKENLKKDGVRVWFDEDEMLVGDSLIKKISEGLENMNYLGVIISNNSNNSSWVQKEVAVAMTKEINGRRVVVLPILLEKCDIPIFLRDKIYADFTENFDAGYNALLKVFTKTKDRVRKIKVLCKGTTSRGKACKKEVGEGSEYCRVHRPSRQKQSSKSLKVRIWDFVKHPIVLALVTLIFSYMLFILGPSQRDINEIKEKLNSIYRDDKVKLEEKYPNGYKLLAFSTDKVVTTNDNNLKEFFIDLDNSKIEMFNERSIEVLVPRFYYHDNKRHQDFKNTHFIIPRTKPKQQLARIGEYRLMIEILGEFNQSVICVLYVEKSNDNFQGIEI